MKINETFHADPYFVMLMVFIILKLTGQVDWTWWAVLLPLWFGVLGTAIFIWLMIRQMRRRR